MQFYIMQAQVYKLESYYYYYVKRYKVSADGVHAVNAR